MRGRSADLQMEGAALAGAGQRDRPRKGGKRTKASKAQELFEEEVKRLVKLIDVKLTLQGLRNVVEYEEALKSALASSASGTYGGMLVDVYVGVVSGSSPEAVKLGYEHVRQKLRGPSSAHVMALFATEDSDVEESSSDEEVGLPSRDDLLAHLNVVQGCVALIARVIERTTEASKRRMLLIPAKKKYAIWAQELRKLVGRKTSGVQFKKLRNSLKICCQQLLTDVMMI